MRADPRDWASSFTGHESFPLRYSWLSKGYESTYGEPNFFSRPDAMVELGVGKNMVSSIRHWGLASQVWQERPGTRGQELEPTVLGKSLLGRWDKYLEHPGTYWTLHWNIVVNPSRATTWAIVFNRSAARFGQDQLLQELSEFAVQRGDRKSSRASLKRDIEVFIRSYLRPEQKKGVYQEDELDCPFKQLGLLRTTAVRGEYELVVGTRPSLPMPVFEYALLSHLGFRTKQKRIDLPIDDLLYGVNSPGRVFRFSESALLSRLQALADDQSGKYLIDETASLRRFIIEPSAPEPLTALGAYYSGLKEPAHA